MISFHRVLHSIVELLWHNLVLSLLHIVIAVAFLLLLLLNDRLASLWSHCCCLKIIWHLFEGSYKFLIVWHLFEVAIARIHFLLFNYWFKSESLTYSRIGSEIGFGESRVTVSDWLKIFSWLLIFFSFVHPASWSLKPVEYLVCVCHMSSCS